MPETWDFETPKRGKSHISGHVYVARECPECGNKKTEKRGTFQLKQSRYDCAVCDNTFYR